MSAMSWSSSRMSSSSCKQALALMDKQRCWHKRHLHVPFQARQHSLGASALPCKCSQGRSNAAGRGPFGLLTGLYSIPHPFYCMNPRHHLHHIRLHQPHSFKRISRYLHHQGEHQALPYQASFVQARGPPAMLWCTYTQTQEHRSIPGVSMQDLPT